MGTATVTIKKRPNLGSVQGVIADIAPSTSYATGGETITPASLGLSTIEAIVVQSNTGGYNYQMIPGSTTASNYLLKIYQGDNTNAAAAPGVEVAAAANLSAQTVRVLAIGNYGAI